MKISSYGYIFRATINNFDIEDSIKNYCTFFDECVLATVPSEDDTRERLFKLEKLYPNLKIIESNIAIEGNNRFDGNLKTLAMKNCSNKIRVILDADERFLLSQRELWNKYAEQLIKMNGLDGLLIPSIDLFGSKDKIRANVQIGQKFRMHKETVFERGVPKDFDFGDKFDTSKSDSTDCIDWNRNLCNFANIVNPLYLNPIFAQHLKDTPYVIHFGFLDLQRRAKLGKDFWAARWQERSGHVENVATTIEELKDEPVVAHNLQVE